MDFKEVHPINALFSMVSTFRGIVIEVSDWQSLNVSASITTKLFDRVIAFKEIQPRNALLPIFLTLSDIEMEVSEEQSSKASLPMLVTLLPIVTEVKRLQ